MKLYYFTVFLFALLTSNLIGQNMVDYNGSWEGEFEDSRAFNFKVALEDLESDNAILKISNSKNAIRRSFQKSSGKLIELPITENLRFIGWISKKGTEIRGFMKSGLLLYHLKLKKNKSNAFEGDWNILMVDELKLNNFYLSVENGSGDEYEAYPILADDRFTGTWCANFKKERDSIFFEDFKTGLIFKGKLLPQKIQIGIYLGDHLVSQAELKKSRTDWEVGRFSENPKTKTPGSLELSEMETHISEGALPNTHAVLVSKDGEMLYENYFNGYDENLPHDMRSASKSISSAIVGIAKDKSLLEHVEESIFNFLPEEYQEINDSIKSKIDLKSLLTMSSGLDAVDFGIDRESVASEDNYQPTGDWTRTILEAPMIHPPKVRSNYGSANPYLLGVAIDSIVSGPLEIFMDKSLFKNLGISNYIIQTDMVGRPYFGGGMYLKPKDMMKFGELYLNKGKWIGKQILSQNWIKDSFKNYHVLENSPDKNGYGYLWWHNHYQFNGKLIKSMEARGAGGQYIFVLPEIEMVVVITSGNYRNGKTQQPELILEKYILPTLSE